MAQTRIEKDNFGPYDNNSLYFVPLNCLLAAIMLLVNNLFYNFQFQY